MARFLFYLFAVMFMIGMISIPGCIEFDEGWLQTIILITVGAIGAFGIPKIFHYEGDYEEY